MSEMEFKFVNYVAKHNKSYATSEEYEARLALFAEMDRQIEEYNASETSSIHGHNKFSDWTQYEKSKLTGAKKAPAGAQYVTPDTAVPDWTVGVNWVTTGDVSPVKDQGQCGSCWSFSSTGAVESANHIKLGYGTTRPVTQYSEQQLVDCVKSCYGCNGGWPGHSFYYYESHGPYLENEYPYTAKDGTCTYVASQSQNLRVASYSHVTADSYTATQAGIAQQPVSILLAAATSYFQSYQSGVLTNALLCGTAMDHAVLGVGYGNENGTNYFLIKNSWSSSWGENGYVKIKADASNNGAGVCVVNYGPVYPTIA